MADSSASSPTPAPGPTPRAPRRQLLVEVAEARRLTPEMIRIVFTGPDLEGFGAGPFTDHYVKLQVPPPGASYSAPFVIDDIKARLPESEWPRTRTYTVRAWDPEKLLLTIDFVVHGDTGVAGPWAAAAAPGDKLHLAGPGGAYAPDPAADWHLMVGDPSVLPAIGASLARVPAGKPVHVLVQVASRADCLPLETSGDLHLQWVQAPEVAPGEPGPLPEALAALDFPPGRVHAFVHGEASAVRAVRRHLLVDRKIPKEDLSVSGYWKRTRTEEGWRADKAEWNRLAETDLEAA